MADKTLEQMLEHLVNNEQEKAEELFHEYVVAKSREIYETLIESEVENDEVEEADEKDEEDAVEEATDESDEDAVEEATNESDEEEVSEELSDDDFVEADDETDDLASALEKPMDGEEEPMDDNEEEIFQDLEAIIDELQSKFDELKGEESDEEPMDGEEEPEMDGEEEPFGGDNEEEVEDSFDVELATVREYVEKIGAPNNADTADNKTSTIDNMKNDMGGTTANILSSKGEESGRTADTPKVEDLGNINQPGGMKSDKMMSKESGGAASSESGADNTDSLFRGKRS